MKEENNDLASRGSRLVAVIIDGIIAVPILIVIAKLTGFWDRIIPRLASGTPLNFEEIIIIFCVGQCLFLILNGYFLSKDGQTIGKRIIGIKILDQDGDGDIDSKDFEIAYQKTASFFSKFKRKEAPKK